MGLFSDGERIHGLDLRIDEVESRRAEDHIWAMQQISDVKQRLLRLEQGAKEGDVSTVSPSCSAKERITELRLTALETKKPIDVMEVVREARGNLVGRHKNTGELLQGANAALALLDFALTQHDKKENA